jgi:hypothetical protein
MVCAIENSQIKCFIYLETHIYFVAGSNSDCCFYCQLWSLTLSFRLMSSRGQKLQCSLSLPFSSLMYLCCSLSSIKVIPYKSYFPCPPGWFLDTCWFQFHPSSRLAYELSVNHLPISVTSTLKSYKGCLILSLPPNHPTSPILQNLWEGLKNL